MFSRVIAIGLSPNIDITDVLATLKVLLEPQRWLSGGLISKVESWFVTRYQAQTSVSFASGRVAMGCLLASFGISRGDEVLVQAFTCVAVPNSVRWTGAIPVYVDIDETLNIDPVQVEKKINKRTKAIIVQHNFGIPAKIEKLRQIADAHELVLIEDCAHALGLSYDGRRLGSFGDGAVFSFGRDKMVSSVFGGMATVSRKAPARVTDKLKKLQNSLPYPGIFWILQQLLHPLVSWLILPTYNLQIGKLLLWLLQKLNLLSFPVYPEEERGQQAAVLNKKYPNALAHLLINQLGKLGKMQSQRRAVCDYYIQELSGKSGFASPAFNAPAAGLLRFPVLVDHPVKLYKLAKRQGIILGSWYSNVIDPKRVDLRAAGYQSGSCPRSEIEAGRIINLPTLISIGQAKRVISAVYGHQN